ncbi:MAG: hypothetical protein OIN83_13285 [Candidatus Methanoperedens sp.]|nr:hypothetical protein [Candidatus Methanoperedens sp.]
MKKIFLLGIVLVVLFGATMSVAAMEASSNPNPGVLPPDSELQGLTYSEWSAKWWQWLLGIPADKNPNLDDSGANCAEGQSGKVWYLAGTFGGPATRTCTIPSGKAIFFPIVNSVWVATEPGDTEEMGRQINKDFIDKTTLLDVKVDGVPLQELKKYRAASPAFDVDLPENNVFGLGPGEYDPAVSDGFWIMLWPLSGGNHEIRIHGTVGKGAKKFDVNVIYNLVVK